MSVLPFVVAGRVAAHVHWAPSSLPSLVPCFPRHSQSPAWSSRPCSTASCLSASSGRCYRYCLATASFGTFRWLLATHPRHTGGWLASSFFLDSRICFPEAYAHYRPRTCSLRCHSYCRRYCCPPPTTTVTLTPTAARGTRHRSGAGRRPARSPAPSGPSRCGWNPRSRCRSHFGSSLGSTSKWLAWRWWGGGARV